jgi:hypothetical protein
LVLAGDAACQNQAEISQPRIIVVRPLSPKDHKFSFTVQIFPNISDKRTGVLTVTCDTGLSCSPSQQVVSLSAPNLQQFSAQSVDDVDLNSAEIDVTLAIDNGPKLSDSKFLDLGLLESISNIGNDMPSDLVGGRSSSFHLWLSAANGSQLRPSSTVFVEVSSLDNCAELKAVGPKEEESSKKFGFKAPATILGGDIEANSVIWVRSSLWSQSSCQLEVAVNSSKGNLTRRRLLLSIKPDFKPAILFCFLGCILQYVVAGLVKIVFLARTKKPVDLGTIFVGSNGVEIIETLLKGCLAFGLAFVLNTTQLVRFGGANNNSLLGYGTFSFLIGFWQLQPLWEAIRQLSGSSEGSERGSDSQTRSPGVEEH